MMRNDDDVGVQRGRCGQLVFGAGLDIAEKHCATAAARTEITQDESFRPLPRLAFLIGHRIVFRMQHLELDSVPVPLQTLRTNFAAHLRFNRRPKQRFATPEIGSRAFLHSLGIRATDVVA